MITNNLKRFGRKEAALDMRIVVGIVSVVGIFLVIKLFTGGGQSSNSETAFHTVKRGDFLVSVVEGGEVNSVKDTVLRSEIEGTARIIYIVPEGSQVKKGDLLVELDAAEFVDKINTEQIALEKSQALYTQSKANLEIAKSTLMTQLRNASNTLNFAKLDLEKYLEGDYQQTILTTSNEITATEQELKVAKDKMDNTMKLYDKGFETLTRLQTAQLNYTNKLFSLIKSQNSLRLFLDYEHRKSITTFESAVADAADDLTRVKLEGEGNMASAEADLASQLNTLLLNSNQLERLKSQLDKSKIYAPQDGLVVYFVSDNRWSNESMIEEGATVRNRQEIIKLPDVSKLKVDLQIPESSIGSVGKGQVAYVIFETKPDQRYKAYVAKVGIVPEASSRRFGGSSTKKYKSEVHLDGPVEGINPGISAQVEIISTNLVDVITIPTQSVTTMKEKTVVYKGGGGKPQPVEVELGLYDDKYIQVINGLQEGDKILLNPPLNYDPDDLDKSVVREGEKVDTKPTDKLPNATEESAPAKPKAGGGQGRQQQGTAEQRQQFMKRFDKDGDGKLSDSERQAMVKQFGGGQGGRSGQGGAGGGGGQRSGGQGRPGGN